MFARLETATQGECITVEEGKSHSCRFCSNHEVGKEQEGMSSEEPGSKWGLILGSLVHDQA